MRCFFLILFLQTNFLSLLSAQDNERSLSGLIEPSQYSWDGDHLRNYGLVTQLHLAQYVYERDSENQLKYFLDASSLSTAKKMEKLLRLEDASYLKYRPMKSELELKEYEAKIFKSLPMPYANFAGTFVAETIAAMKNEVYNKSFEEYHQEIMKLDPSGKNWTISQMVQAGRDPVGFYTRLSELPRNIQETIARKQFESIEGGVKEIQKSILESGEASRKHLGLALAGIGKVAEITRDISKDIFDEVKRSISHRAVMEKHVLLGLSPHDQIKAIEKGEFTSVSKEDLDKILSVANFRYGMEITASSVNNVAEIVKNIGVHPKLENAITKGQQVLNVAFSSVMAISTKGAFGILDAAVGITSLFAKKKGPDPMAEIMKSLIEIKKILQENHAEVMEKLTRIHKEIHLLHEIEMEKLEEIQTSVNYFLAKAGAADRWKLNECLHFHNSKSGKQGYGYDDELKIFPNIGLMKEHFKMNIRAYADCREGLHDVFGRTPESGLGSHPLFDYVLNINSISKDERTINAPGEISSIVEQSKAMADVYARLYQYIGNKNDEDDKSKLFLNDIRNLLIPVSHIEQMDFFKGNAFYAESELEQSFPRILPLENDFIYELNVVLQGLLAPNMIIQATKGLIGIYSYIDLTRGNNEIFQEFDLDFSSLSLRLASALEYLENALTYVNLAIVQQNLLAGSGVLPQIYKSIDDVWKTSKTHKAFIENPKIQEILEIFKTNTLLATNYFVFHANKVFQLEGKDNKFYSTLFNTKFVDHRHFFSLYPFADEFKFGLKQGTADASWTMKIGNFKYRLPNSKEVESNLFNKGTALDSLFELRDALIDILHWYKFSESLNPEEMKFHFEVLKSNMNFYKEIINS